MLERPVSIDGTIYRQHEVVAMTHELAGATLTRVRSSAGDAVVHTSHELTQNIGMTFAEAESETFALPFFDEVQDPYAEIISEVSEILTDEQAADVPQVFPEWATDTAYKVDDRRRYGSKLYKCLQAHTSQADWTPDVAVSLWVEIAKPGEIPVWRQPTGAQDAYNTGDKVHYPDADGPIYESLIDANVFSPADYPAGWQLVEGE